MTKLDPTITGYTIRDVRLPTSLDGVGNDPMNSAGEQSLACVFLQTNTALQGVGFTFSHGQGNEVMCAGIKCIVPRLVGHKLSEFVSDFGKTQREIGSGQHRFISPERGLMQLAQCAVLNALWDLWAKAENKPVWQLVADMSPEELVRCIDFRYLSEVITPEQAVERLHKVRQGREERLALVEKSQAVPGYNTSIGWLGYSDEKIEANLREALDQGFRHFKLKVGIDLEGDKRRLGMIRRVAGDDVVIMTDVNEIWDVEECVEYMPKLAEFKPWFIEEPTSPDDVLGHAYIRKKLKPYGIGVATGEHVNNRVIFKQLLQAEALEAVQLDSMRLAGLNEILSVMLMAAVFDVPVVPHAGGFGSVELCSHISTIDYLVISGKKSILEYTDHAHEHFVNGASFANGFHVTPTTPGYSSDFNESVFTEFEYPNGKFWMTDKGKEMMADPWRGVPARQTS